MRLSSALSQKMRFFACWLPLFLVVQFVGAVVIGSVEPDGFDRCTASPTPDEMRFQVWVAVFVACACAGLALWLLRRYWLVAAIWILIFASVPYLIVLRPPLESC